MSHLDRRRLELLKKVEEASDAKEAADKEYDLAIGAALAGGCLVKHVAEFARVSRQSLYRSHNAAETGARARRQGVDRLREQLGIDAGGEATGTDCSDAARCTGERPVEQAIAEERESSSRADSIPLDGHHQSPSTSTGSPPAGGHHPLASPQPGSRFLPPRKVGRRGPSFWPADVPKLGSNTADKRSAPTGQPHIYKPGDDLLGTCLPSEPWGPEHASELAAALAAALVFNPRCHDELWKSKTTGRISSDDWVHHAVVLRGLLKFEVQRRMFDAWFKLVPIPKDDRTPAEQDVIGRSEDLDPTVMRWIKRQDLDEWRGRVAAYERAPSGQFIRYSRYA